MNLPISSIPIDGFLPLFKDSFKANKLYFQRVSPVINLLVCGVLGNAILLLEFPGEDLPTTIYLRKFVIGQLAPFFLDRAAKLLPSTSDLFPLISLCHYLYLLVHYFSFGRSSNLTVAAP